MTAAFYHKSMLDKITSQLEKHQLRMQSLAEKYPAVLIEIADEEQNKKLMNINTQEEYRRYMGSEYFLDDPSRLRLANLETLRK